MDAPLAANASLIAGAPLVATVALLFAAATAGAAPRLTRAVATGAGALAFALGFGSLGVTLVAGTTDAAIGVAGVELGIRLDTFSALMFALVTFVGFIVIQYARNYLAGDPRQPGFFARLTLTLASVILLVTAGGLFQLAAMWIAMSLALHSLLVFRPERRGAVLAARKKFALARLGDAGLVFAAFLLIQAFDSARLADIFAAAAMARETGEVPAQAGAAAVLIALAAALKTAQFPTHGWLTEVMETPTPVSALLHAGVINAGGFLVIRFADVMVLSTPALQLLIVIGAVTAAFGSVVMLTQPSIKIALAYSTVGQMGFMLLQCGLGAFAPATLHILAHSLYKAHAFLSAGGAAADVTTSTPAARAHPAALGLGIAAALGIYAGVAALFGYAITRSPTVVGLGAVFVMGLVLMLARAAADARVLVRAVGLSAGASAAYFALQGGVAFALRGAIPEAAPLDPLARGLLAVVLSGFAVTILAQALAPARTRGVARALYVHIANGFYANALFNRLAGALRLRAAPAPRA